MKRMDRPTFGNNLVNFHLCDVVCHRCDLHMGVRVQTLRDDNTATPKAKGCNTKCHFEVDASDCGSAGSMLKARP